MFNNLNDMSKISSDYLMRPKLYLSPLAPPDGRQLNALRSQRVKLPPGLHDYSQKELNSIKEPRGKTKSCRCGGFFSSSSSNTLANTAAATPSFLCLHQVAQCPVGPAKIYGNCSPMAPSNNLWKEVKTCSSAHGLWLQK